MKLTRSRPQTLFAALLASLIIWAIAQPGGFVQTANAQQRGLRERLVERASQITGDDFPVYVRTERGAHVFARSEPRREALDAIDDGLTELFSIARRHGYHARLDYSEYVVFIARADRTKDSAGAYSPDIAIPAAQYAGSVYDQGGYIYAAGMVMAYNPCAFIIAEHERDMQRISNVVRYEGEHLILYHNDRSLYERTADHSRGGGHPILR